MITPKKIDRILNDRRDPQLVAAVMQAAQLNIKIDAEVFWRSVMIDAAESIGCPPAELDITRNHHVRTLELVALSFWRDEISGDPGSLTSSQSCYLQKAL